MSFIEDLLIELGREGFYFFLKRIGMIIKWMFYFGRKPFSKIKKENYNTRIGLLMFIIIIIIVIYCLN